MNMKVVVIQSIISVIGFVVTYICMRKSFKNELIKQKNLIHIERMQNITYEVLNLMNAENGKYAAELIGEKEYNELITTIYAFGSYKAISIVSLLQKENLLGQLANNNYRMISFYVLLATQIKYDVTGIAISPNDWLNIKISDYNSNQQIHEGFKRENNKLVRELDLNKKFEIK